MSETEYEGYFEITDKQGPSETEFQCSCGNLVWDVDFHINFHRLFGQVCTVKRQV